jgi:L-ascorbate metabolism protein UlaG (beta-lactamase superfamily)
MLVEWLGINGFRFYFNEKIILLDPWVTRNNSKVCDKTAIAEYIPAADYIFIGHSHWDHLADAAEIYRQTGAVIVGSQTTMNICRAQGVPESHLKEFTAGQTLRFADFSVDVFASVHKQPMVYPGIYGTVPGKIETIADFLEGGTFALRFHFDNLTVLNVGSANFIREQLRGVKCNYLLAGIAGRADAYLPDLINCVSPDVVIPTHFDCFETPLEDDCIGVSIEDFETEMASVAPGLKTIIPHPLQELNFV